MNKALLKLSMDYVRRLALAIAFEEYANNNKSLLGASEDITSLKNKLIESINLTDYVNADDFKDEDKFIFDTFFCSFDVIRIKAEESFQSILDYELQNRIALTVLEYMIKEGYWIYYPKSNFENILHVDLDYVNDNIVMEYNESLLNKAAKESQQVWFTHLLGDTVENEYHNAMTWILRNGADTTEHTYFCDEFQVYGNGESFDKIMKSLKKKNII